MSTVDTTTNKALNIVILAGDLLQHGTIHYQIKHDDTVWPYWIRAGSRKEAEVIAQEKGRLREDLGLIEFARFDLEGGAHAELEDLLQVDEKSGDQKYNVTFEVSSDYDSDDSDSDDDDDNEGNDLFGV